MKKILKHLRDNWIRHGFETLVVIVGVLIAFALNDWNEERLRRVEEVSAISRILGDIQRDLKLFELLLEEVDKKEESLWRIKKVFSEGKTPVSHSLLKDIIMGSNWGWHQGVAQRSTYDDLLGSGKLRIIADQQVRFKIANYYSLFEDTQSRTDERETSYPNYSYQLVPRGISTSKLEGEFELESNLSEVQLSELVTLIQESTIRDYVTGEINFARFIRGTTLKLQSDADDLVKLLEVYQKEI